MNTLVCFAVKQEAMYFAPAPAGCSTLIAGMGQTNAAIALRKALAGGRPGIVISAGFAGALRPELGLGTVVFAAGPDTGLFDKLARAGAKPGRFHCADHVAVTAAEKAAQWKATGADAVDMESAVIHAICREHRIPSATVRAISDAADADLPLDFNALMTGDNRINYARMAWMLAFAPWKIPALLRFRRHTMSAARRLAEVLRRSLGPG